MIPRKTAAGIVMLAGLVAVSFWAGRSTKDRRFEPIEGLDLRLDYALQDFEARFYDDQGLPSVHLRAPELKNDAGSGVGEIRAPVFDVTHRGNIWQINAESATVAADRDFVILNGNVEMVKAGGPGMPPLRINTSQMVLEIAPRIARSSRRVQISEGADKMEAMGFMVNMTDNRFSLLKEVTLTYAVDAP